MTTKFESRGPTYEEFDLALPRQYGPSQLLTKCWLLHFQCPEHAQQQCLWTKVVQQNSKV